MSKGVSFLPIVIRNPQGPVDRGMRQHPIPSSDGAQRRLAPTLTGERNRYELERQLWEARAQDPSHLPVYFALYKFYASAGRTTDGIRVLRLALTEAARQGGFHPDWERLNLDCEPVELRATKAGRFYLFTLKILAEAKLQQGSKNEARSLLAHLRRLTMGGERPEAAMSPQHPSPSHG